jgi:hypothetical protein
MTALLERFRHLRVFLDGTAALLARRNTRLPHLAPGGTATLLGNHGLSGGTIITRRVYTCLIVRIMNYNSENSLPLDGGFFKRTLLGPDDTLVLGVRIILDRTFDTEDFTVTGRLTGSTVVGVFGVVDFMGIPVAFEPTDADDSARVSVSLKDIATDEREDIRFVSAFWYTGTEQGRATVSCLSRRWVERDFPPFL